jgi:hypothetical protein
MGMKSTAGGGAAARGVRCQSASTSETLLRAEIGFWRELLDECNPSVPADSIERMRQALALAERRFLELCRGVGEGAESSDRPEEASLANRDCLH